MWNTKWFGSVDMLVQVFKNDSKSYFELFTRLLGKKQKIP